MAPVEVVVGGQGAVGVALDQDAEAVQRVADEQRLAGLRVPQEARRHVVVVTDAARRGMTVAAVGHLVRGCITSLRVDGFEQQRAVDEDTDRAEADAARLRDALGLRGDSGADVASADRVGVAVVRVRGVRRRDRDVPVRLPTGSRLPDSTRLSPHTFVSKRASGHSTSPCTIGRCDDRLVNTIERRSQPYAGTERELLLDWLEFQRETMAQKCSGLTGDALGTRAAPPSTLTLGRLLRHLADMERMDAQILAGEPVTSLYEEPGDDADDADNGTEDGSDAEPEGGMYDWSLYDVDDDALAVWCEQCDRLRAVVEGKELDDRAPGDFAVLTVRSVLLALTMEYARHNGHADLLRERLDGRVGY